ncbi:hypothetical protein NBRC111894_1566 [Sporolactobacillus inulinus]|uniref:Uncharacterized protein n=1 Tax=Sporolactobacillus inulinus TaxID=2078 RepID=A0A4Y1ZAB8_9BACL|nr:hypothetical protein NBRC111894_1566 [Sporolactobacillus inulinus]
MRRFPNKPYPRYQPQKKMIKIEGEWMKTLYCVRHGETRLNSLNCSQEWADFPLTKGVQIW